jgi:hypothetical protein
VPFFLLQQGTRERGVRVLEPSNREGVRRVSEQGRGGSKEEKEAARRIGAGRRGAEQEGLRVSRRDRGVSRRDRGGLGKKGALQDPR